MIGSSGGGDQRCYQFSMDKVCAVLVILCLVLLPVVSSDEEIIALASWKESLAFETTSSNGSSELELPTRETKVCRRMSTSSQINKSYIVRGVFRHGNSAKQPPALNISINSELFRNVDTSKDLVIQVPLDPGNSTLLYCLMPAPSGLMTIMPTLELFLAPKLSYSRKLLERQHQSPLSVFGIISTVLISLTTLTMVTALCITKLFQALKGTPPVQPQSSPRIYESSMELKVNKEPINIKQYMLKELEEAIGIKIAEGGFGYVYRGTLINRQEVAIKVRSSTSSQGLREFTAELTLLSKIRHPNLVPLLGYCTEGQHEMLVYPYMSNGTLQDRLYGEAATRKPLDWQTRLSIALGAARGLNFLHTSGPRPIIHRDVKSSNILLDDSMNARVADFGFSRFAPQEDDSLVSVEVRGTTGYLDPEYYMTQMLTTKSDVFSFGVVLLEIVCGREPLNLRRPRSEASLVDWARKSISEANIQSIVDPSISASYTPEAMWRVVEVAYASVETFAARRPDMAGVVKELDDALIIENNASQYMLSMDSIGSFRRSSSMKALPALVLPFDPSPAFSETLDSPHPR